MAEGMTYLHLRDGISSQGYREAKSRGIGHTQELQEILTSKPQRMKIEELEKQLAESKQCQASAELNSAQVEKQTLGMNLKLRKQTDTITADRKEIRALNAIILESIPSAETFSQRDIKNLFMEFDVSIEHLVKKYFQDVNKSTNWPYYDQIRGGEDKDYFLQAYFADSIAETYFGTTAVKLFGVERKMEEALGQFEAGLQAVGEEQLASTKLADWRAETVKLGKLLNQSHVRDKITKDAFRAYEHLFTPTARSSSSGRHPGTLKMSPKFREAVDDLSGLAFRLALALRSVRPVYSWDQLKMRHGFDV